MANFVLNYHMNFDGDYVIVRDVPSSVELDSSGSVVVGQPPIIQLYAKLTTDPRPPVTWNNVHTPNNPFTIGGDDQPEGMNYFYEWNTSFDEGGTSYQPGASIPLTEPVTDLYAMWGGPTYMDVYDLAMLDPTPPLGGSQTFAGWSSVPTGGIIVWGEEQYSSNTLYAQYQDPALAYEINYDTSNSDEEMDIEPTIKYYGLSVTLTSVILYKDGYTFLGWSTSAAATTAEYAPGASFNVEISSDITLYSVFGSEVYTVTFDLNGGTYTGGGALTQQIPSGGNAVLPNNPTRPNRQFKGWLGNPNNILANTTITAMWDAIAIWRWDGNAWKKFS